MSASTQHRLRKHPDYQRVYKDARKQWARQIAYFGALRAPGSPAAVRSETAGPRVGLTVPKAAVRRAVDRNRIKRRLRELVRGALPLLGDLPVDVVLHPKPSVLHAEFGLLQREVAQVFRAVASQAHKAHPHSAPEPSAKPGANRESGEQQAPGVHTVHGVDAPR